MHYYRYLLIGVLTCWHWPTLAIDRITQRPVETLLQNVWDQANVTSNFIMAPLEIFSLYRTIYNTSHEFKANTSPPHIVSSNAVVKIAEGTALINSITIQARWTYNFQRRDGHKRLFYSTCHSHVYTDFMRKDDIFLYTALPAEFNGTAVEIPLQQHEVKMLILLPNTMDGLPRLEQQIFQNLSSFQEIVIQRLQPTVVRIYIPKFKIEGLVHLEDAFNDYASNTSHSAADENGTFSRSGNFSKIVQRTLLEVNESGIGQAQRTVLFWNASSSLRITPKIFEINHPFLFLIRSAAGIEFVGRIVFL